MAQPISFLHGFKVISPDLMMIVWRISKPILGLSGLAASGRADTGAEEAEINVTEEELNTAVVNREIQILSI